MVARSFATLVLCLAPAVLAAPARAQVSPSAIMVRMPDVSASEIVFLYAGDLWIVDKTGGVARRVTSGPGPEHFPKFSPDGKRLAYVAGYQGGRDLYVLDVAAGLPVRVTHHPTGETLCDWFPSGEELLFWSPQASGHRRAPKLFRVAAEGGLASEVPVPYGTFGGIDESGEWLAYTPLTREFRTWKRYQGGMAQDVWLFNLRTHEARQLTDHPGTDAMPMWYGRKVVFLSDRDDRGVLNLYSQDIDSGQVERLTDFTDFDVKFPSIGPQDVVFESGGKLWRHELATGNNVQVEVVLPGDRPRLLPRRVELAERIQTADVSPKAKRAVLEARGEILTIPVESGFVRNLTGTSGVAERDPAWSPDGKWIAYWSDRSGEYELVLRRSDGKAFEGADEHGERRLTNLGAGWKHAPSWSPDSERLAFATHDGGLHLIELEDGSTKLLDTNPDRGPISPSFSHDGSWMAWSRRSSATRLGALFLYDVANAALHEVTAGQFDDQDPTFDAKGDWLFFRSSRTFQPSYSDFDTTWIYTNADTLMAVPLRAEVEVPWGPTNDEEELDGEDEDDGKDEDEDEDPDEEDGDDEGEEDDEGADDEVQDSEESDEAQEGDEAASEEEDAADDDEEKDEEPIVIELDGFEQRALPLPAKPGRIRGLVGLEKKLLFSRLPRTGEDGGSNKLVLYDLEEEEEKTVIEGVNQYSLTPDRKKLLVRQGDKLGVISVAPDQKLEKPIDLSKLAVSVDPREEWRQMLVDAWRIFRDWFYDEGMHGVDWNGVRERYTAALSDVTTREDLHFLLGEMISELNVGHAYNAGPPEGMEDAPDGDGTGLLGVDWNLEQGAYRIARILGGGPYDHDGRAPVAMPGVDVKVGDWLLEVNGLPVDATRDVHASLVGTAGQPTLLTVNASPTLDGNERRVLVRPLRDEGDLRYRDWVADRRARVTERSGGKVGYVHVPDTGVNGQNELVRQFMGQMHLPALLIDERWNGGGQIPTRFIELLNRPVTNYWAVRHGEDWTWPPVGHRGPKAMLINHSAGSGGDAFPYYFRQAGLGKLIGTRTWGGLVGLSGNPRLVDGAMVRVPTFAFYELDGTWGVEGYGVAPDIEVVDDPAKMVDGTDVQLDAAVDHLLAELERNPAAERVRPAAPNRAGPGLSNPADR